MFSRLSYRRLKNHCVISLAVIPSRPGSQYLPERRSVLHLQSIRAARHQSHVEEIPLKAEDVDRRQQLGPVDFYYGRIHYESLHVFPLGGRFTVCFLATMVRPLVTVGDSATRLQLEKCCQLPADTTFLHSENLVHL